MRKTASGICAAICRMLSACARTEMAQFRAGAGQEAFIRDGQPAIVSRLKNSLVLVRPASRQFQAGQRPVYVAAMYNLTARPLQFSVNGLSVTQLREGQPVAQLKVYTYEELMAEERNRQIARTVLTGMVVVGNSAAAANAGHYDSTATISGPRGTAMVSVSGYDPTAAAIAQANAAAQNEAMIANTIETGHRNMAMLERTVIKDNTLFPGEWYGGQIQFDAPDSKIGKSYVIMLQVGADLHKIEVSQNPV